MAENDKTIGGRGRRNRNNEDVHATGKASRDNNDVHATGKASRGNDNDIHATGKATRGGDAHSTGKATRRPPKNAQPEQENLKPYEQQGNDDLRRRLNEKAQDKSGKEWPDEFVLEGVKYKNEGVLSDSSGEAIVFTVSRGGKKYALKIYYYDPEHRPNHAVLEKIRKLGGSGLLVNIVSHGEWDNPNQPGEKNDYELMDFCEGGSLDGVILDGNEKTLSEVAVRMASAIDFLAKHGILHRDIKPANFFYADKNKTQIVLADFGISVECPQGGIVKIDEMRSPVYAAPEFYTNVPGEPAEVGVESDYFSLGVALLCLWTGKDKFTANESQLLRSKLNETLPIPSNMSGHMASLIKALTHLKMSDRATFDDIKRWVKGENLDKEGVTTANSDFRIVFNSAKNQVANSPAELARLLVEDSALGKKYLYSGRVTRWLEETGRNEIAVNVEDIVEKIYPSNQEAGLWTVAYMLDPSMEYIAPDGSRHNDPGEISLYITNNHTQMAREVMSPDSRLMIYLRAVGLKNTAETVLDYVKNAPKDFDEAYKGLLATYYLALLIDPELPLPVYSHKDGFVYVETIKEILDILHDNILTEGFGYLNWYMLTSPVIVAWLAPRNPALAGKIRQLLDNPSDDPKSVNYNSNNAYRIAFELDPEADFYYNTDPNAPDRVYTIPQVGEYLEEKLAGAVSGEENAEAVLGMLLNFKDSLVADYLRSRGKNYMTFLEWMEFCLDCDNKDNTSKPGPYDLIIGAYKGIMGFLGRAPYYPLAGKKLTDPSQLSSIPRNELKNAVDGQHRTIREGGKPQPWLDAWLTLFYQENPQLDLSQKFTYEKETAKYMDLLCEIAPGGYYQNRYSYAMEEINDSAKQIKSGTKNVVRNRWIYLLLSWIPGLLIIGGLLLFGLPEGNPIKGHVVPTLLILLVGFTIYRFFHEYISGMSNFELFVDVPVAAGWAIGVTIFLYAGFSIFPEYLHYIIMGLIAYLLIKNTIEMMWHKKVDTGGVTITGDEFEYKQLDALYYTFRQSNNTIENVLTKYAEMQGGYDKSANNNNFVVGMGLITRMWMFFALWYLATPQVSGERSWASENQAIEIVKGKWVLGSWTVKYASGSTKIICNIDSVEDGKYIYGTMTIAGQAPVKAKGNVKSENDTVPLSFSFWPVDGGGAMKQCVSAEYISRNNEMKGYYNDRKGVSHQINFIATPLSGNASTKQSKSEAKPVKPTKKAEVKEEANAEEQSESILPELPGYESNAEQEAQPAAAEEPQPAVQPEPQPEPQKAPEKKNRPKFRPAN